MPILGRIDDLGLVFLIVYYLKTGRLPGFVSKIIGWLFGTPGRKRYSDPGAHSRGSGSSGSAHGDSGAKDPYEVLGISPGASSREKHEAYRRLAHQYHPDKVSHLGEEFQELARKKFIEIQQAYETLTGKSG
ncbi:MAG: J domain-containing protein [Desulfobacteraceae bacterium]|nr:J domain-containing protein [Desulfobacteraceae bacterium]